MRLATVGLVACCLVSSPGCSRQAESNPAASLTATPSPTQRQPSPNVFDEYLDSEFPAADGFDFAVGNPDGPAASAGGTSSVRDGRWRLSRGFAPEQPSGASPGEDWTCIEPDQLEVRAIANGRVAFAEGGGDQWGKVIAIEHVYYLNQHKNRIRSVYANLEELMVKAGDQVSRGQTIAVARKESGPFFGGQLHLEIRREESIPPVYWPSSEGRDSEWVKQKYLAPGEFIGGHRKLNVPPKEPVLVLVDQELYKLRLYRNGVLNGEADISLGQGRGQKRLQGDNKTPRGMYFVTQKHRGKIGGTYGAYYGGYWIKINYPNRFDAERGRGEGLVSAQQEALIRARWEQRSPTLETTPLGGGIGFHGWIREWQNHGPRHLSWGCVVLHLYDLNVMFDRIPIGTMVVIF
jgi:murein DD-endopeptidase MepM/ murein hydrolase activator NlpD